MNPSEPGGNRGAVVDLLAGNLDRPHVRLFGNPERWSSSSTPFIKRALLQIARRAPVASAAELFKGRMPEERAILEKIIPKAKGPGRE